ncbi:MAG: stringent starvation protein B [Sulfuricaulis sp.]
MSPLKLYLLRAVHDWAVDAGFTPYVLVDATAAGVKVPPGYVENGRIVLNVHPRATSYLEFSDDVMRFSARFASQSFAVTIPYAAVLSIYARENSQGISFPESTAVDNRDPGRGGQPPEGQPPSKGPTLRVVK